MKHLISLLCATAIITSCEKIDLQKYDQAQCTFRVVASGISSRASKVTDFRTLIVTDVMDGRADQRLVQHSTDVDFGNPTLTLTKGKHTITFLATDADHTDITADVASWSKVGDTFGKTLTIDIKDNAQQQVVLTRQCAWLEWQGEGSLTVSGIVNSISTTTMATAFVGTTSGNELTDGPSSRAASGSVTLAKGEGIYTLIPASGIVTLDNGKQITIERNTRHVLTSRDQDNVTGGGTDSGAQDGETLVLTNDTAQFFMADMELQGISLEQYPTPHMQLSSQMSPYRMPTRLEASVLRNATTTLPDGTYSGTRMLCYDTPLDAGKKVNSTEYGTGSYYTYIYASGGSVTKAGTKTAYSIKPIRTAPLQPLGTRFSISADFGWE